MLRGVQIDGVLSALSSDRLFIPDIRKLIGETPGMPKAGNEQVVSWLKETLLRVRCIALALVIATFTCFLQPSRQSKTPHYVGTDSIEDAQQEEKLSAMSFKSLSSFSQSTSYLEFGSEYAKKALNLSKLKGLPENVATLQRKPSFESIRTGKKQHP